jgi:hypothetical protein
MTGIVLPRRPQRVFEIVRVDDGRPSPARESLHANAQKPAEVVADVFHGSIGVSEPEKSRQLLEQRPNPVDLLRVGVLGCPVLHWVPSWQALLEG